MVACLEYRIIEGVRGTSLGVGRVVACLEYSIIEGVKGTSLGVGRVVANV